VDLHSGGVDLRLGALARFWVSAAAARRWRRGGDLGRGRGARARSGFGAAAVIWGGASRDWRSDAVESGSGLGEGRG